MKKLIKPCVFILSLLPLLGLVLGVFTNKLGANPVEFVIRDLGEWALRFLLLGLVISPLFKLTRWGWLMSLRRMIGLYAFFYLSLHMAAYIGFDLSLDMGALWRDVLKRKFITVGMLAFVLLLPLAITSTNRMIKRLGAGRWKRLHTLVYPIAILGVLHFYWMAKADKREPLIYAAILAFLLLLRLLPRAKRA